MRVGKLNDCLEYDLAIRTINGGLHLVRTQMIQCVDEQGNPNGSYGVSMQKAVDMLRKYGRLTVAYEFDGSETRTITRGKISEIYSVRTKNGPIVTVAPPKKSVLGKLTERVNQFFR